MNEKSLEVYARLASLCAVHEAMVKANPLPYIERAMKQNMFLREAIEDATAHLDGVTSFDLARDNFPNMPPSIVETVTIRNRKAREALTAGLKKAQEAGRK